MFINKKSKLLYWVPTIIWMAIIFYLSSKPRISVSDNYAINFLFFKTLHIIEYCILYILWTNSLVKTTNLPRKKIYLYAFTAVFAYAVSDELHQLFVPTREGKIQDVAIDCIGIALGFFISKKIMR